MARSKSVKKTKTAKKSAKSAQKSRKTANSNKKAGKLLRELNAALDAINAVPAELVNRRTVAAARVALENLIEDVEGNPGTFESTGG